MNVVEQTVLFGALFQTPRRQKRLFCRYHDGNRNPHLLIAPFKEEDEWDSPHIVRYYDVMSDEEIEKIKQLAKPKVSLPSSPWLLIECFHLRAETRQRIWGNDFILQIKPCETKGNNFRTAWWCGTLKPRLLKVFMQCCTWLCKIPQ